MANQKARPMPTRGMRGPAPEVKDPVGIFKRLIGVIVKSYPIHLIVVLVSILLSSYAMVQGNLFLKTLIDNYIEPLIGQTNPTYGPLAKALFM